MIEHCYFYSLAADFQTRKKWQFLNRRVDMEQFRQFRWSFDQQEFVSRLLSQIKMSSNLQTLCEQCGRPLTSVLLLILRTLGLTSRTKPFDWQQLKSAVRLKYSQS